MVGHGLPAGGPEVHSFNTHPPTLSSYRLETGGQVLLGYKNESVMDSASILSSLVGSEDLYIYLL